MAIGDVSAASTASSFNVNLQKQQSDQETKIATTLLNSAAKSPTPGNSSGPPKIVDVTA